MPPPSRVATAGWESRVLSSWRGSRRRRVAWVALILAVLLAHALLGLRVASSVIGWNTGPRSKPMVVTFAKRELPKAPPATLAPAAAPAPPPRRAVRPARPASEPASATASDAVLAESHAALLRQALALAASSASAASTASAMPAPAVASAPAAAMAVAVAPSSNQSGRVRVTAIGSGNVSAPVTGPAGPEFEWPPATRLTYTLTGERGEGRHIYGKSTVEWRREGARYQVQFDVHISPLIDQHMYSEGILGADGLSPRHYDESFSFLFATPRTRKIEFGDSEVTLNTGNRVIKLPQTQDGASQFVQFVWMFYNHPDWLAPGHVVQIPLALPNNLRLWNYMVMGTERLDLAFGAIDAVHLKPILDGPRRPNEYPFDIWTAPSLEYLPVQILVKVDEHTWALLALDDLPMQAAGEQPAPPPPKSQAFPTPPSVGER